MILKSASPIPTITMDTGYSESSTMASIVFLVSVMAPSVRIRQISYFCFTIFRPFILSSSILFSIYSFCCLNKGAKLVGPNSSAFEMPFRYAYTMPSTPITSGLKILPLRAKQGESICSPPILILP